MNSVRIVAKADQPGGTVVDADTGEPVSMVRTAAISLGADRVPTALLEVFVAEADVTVEAEDITWLGLDRVPVEALRSELARREGPQV